MSGNRKFPFIKPNFKKVPQVEEDELVEDDIREIVVEHKSGFNTIEVLIIIIISIAFGVVVGCSVTFFRQEYRGEKVSSSLQELIAVYNNILEDYYKNVDERDLVDAAVEGMLSSLDDPYSTYMDEENAATFHETVDGSYVGIGITIAMNADKKFYVVSVVEDSPAEKANIQVGDYLIESRRVRHGKIKPAFGYIVHKDGKSVGFSGDSMYCPMIDKIVENSDISILDMSLKAEGNRSHMGYLDIKEICNKYQEKMIVATHMHNSAREVAVNNPIKNLIIPEENYEINL